ncbi:hypothetical protein D3C78_780860 [compost metagenome]
MSILTKERLQQLADENTICKVSRDERIAMARQLLAGLEQEPVAWVRYCSDGTIDGPLLNYQIDDCRKPSWSPLYAAPQLPQPAVLPLAVSWEDVPEEITEDDMGLASA